MKALMLGVVLLCSSILHAQETAVDADSLMLEQATDFQLFAAPFFNVNQFVETGSTFVGARFGLVFRERLEVSASYTISVDDFNQQIIFPSRHSFDQKNIGVYAQYSFLNKKIRPLVGLGMEYGMVTWEPDYDSKDSFLDNVFIYSMYAGASWELHRTLTIQADIGYNVGSDVELIGLEQSDYNGIRGDILLKFRFLNF